MLLCALSVNAYAIDSPVNRLQSSGAQNQTVRALQFINQNQWNLARDVAAATRDPLASKLYYWMQFTQKRDVDNYGRLVQFIRQNPDWPGISGLKKKAEKHMPSNTSPAEALAWFNDYEPQTANGVDRYMNALIGSGQSAKAKTFFANWWATTTLSRDEQRRLFRKYSTYLDRAAHMRRFDTMLYRGQNANARAIAGVLEKGYPALAEARIALRSGDKNVTGLINAVPRNLQSDPGLLFERLRWRRKNDQDMGAIEILHRPPALSKIQNPKEWWRERHILMRRLIERKQYQSAYLLAVKHIQEPGTFEYAQAQWMAGWLALNYMDKPTDALQHFEALYQNVKTPISLSRGAYWSGKAAQAIKADEIAKTWFEKSAKHSTAFYGQLAGAELGMTGVLPNAKPPPLTQADKATFAKMELVQASNLFNRAGMRSEASRFLSAFVETQGTAKAYHYAAALALKNGRTDDAVRISKKATSKGLFLTAQSYPLMTQYLKGVNNLEWALAHAITRQESVFDTKANSPAGALGLMQLMPATAKETARKLGVPHSTSMLTSNPAHNVKLGSAYLSRMISRYNGAYPMAIAAYNAGPGRVDQWIKTFGDPRKGEIEWIDWMESIPIYETRNYVQRVLEGVYVYRLRLRKIQTPSTAPIHIALVSK